jgi:ActR/RegA family two-component response regulator
MNFSTLPRQSAPHVHSVRPARILMIDDGSDVGIGLLLLFRIWGHTVSVAHSWRQGLQRAGALDPQLVLVNLGLVAGEALESVVRALEPTLNGSRVVALRDGLAYFVEETEQGPQLTLAQTAKLRAFVKSTSD